MMHLFAGDDDGRFPEAALVKLDGNLYGTTTEGGPYGSKCSDGKCGAVFTLTP